MICSVDDLRSSLGCLTTENEEQREQQIRILKEELDYENKYKFRTTVVKILEARIRKLEKLKF